MNEINTPCDLCNCYWGPPGNRKCDINLTRKFGRPRIPPQCPLGYQPTLRGMPEFVKQIEDILIAKLVLKNAAMARELEREIGIDSERLGAILRHMRRRGMVKKMAGGHQGAARWAINREGN